MAKGGAGGEKKGKDAILKAATQKKGAHKKWNKGKAKEKAVHEVILDRETYDRLLANIPKLGKHISVSAVVDKYKVVGSIARALLRKLHQSGVLKTAELHSKQALYTPAVVAEPVAAVVGAPADGVKTKKEAQPKKK